LEGPYISSNVEERKKIPVSDLITFKGILAGKEVTILKDDGCNINIISSDFVKRNRHLLNVDFQEI